MGTETHRALHICRYFRRLSARNKTRDLRHSQSGLQTPWARLNPGSDPVSRDHFLPLGYTNQEWFPTNQGSSGVGLHKKKEDKPCCIPALGLISWPHQLQDAARQLLSSTGLQQQKGFINCTGTTSALLLLSLVIPRCLGAADTAFLPSGYLIPFLWVPCWLRSLPSPL